MGREATVLLPIKEDILRCEKLWENVHHFFFPTETQLMVLFWGGSTHEWHTAKGKAVVCTG